MAARDDEHAADLHLWGRRLIERALEQTHVCVPARVVRYTAGPHPTVSAQPLVKRARDDGDSTSSPTLDDVPVVFPGSRGFRLDFQLGDGDLVLLVVADRSIDDLATLMQTPAIMLPVETDPRDTRTHSLSDAFALPLATYGNLLPGSGPTAVPGSQLDLLEFIDTFIAQLQVATTLVAGVPTPLDPATQAIFLAMRARLALLL